MIPHSTPSPHIEVVIESRCFCCSKWVKSPQKESQKNSEQKSYNIFKKAIKEKDTNILAR